MSAGYALPDGDAYTEEVACIKVYVPDRPEYRRALLGSITYLGTWIAWERDEQKRGRDASRAWRRANDRTLNEWAEGCDCEECEYCFASIDEIEEWIAESDEMTINVVQNCCCGCGCGRQCDGHQPPDPPDDYVPPWDDPEGDAPPIPGQDYLQAKCNAIAYLLYAYRLAVLQWIDALETYEGFLQWWGGLFGSLVTGDLPDLAYGTYLQLLAMAQGYSSPVGLITTMYDEHYNEMRCHLYSGRDASTTFDTWMTYLSATVWAPMPTAVRVALLQIASLMPIETIFDDPESLDLPAGFSNRDCSDCDVPGEQVPVDDIADTCLPSDWRIRQNGGVGVENPPSENAEGVTYSYGVEDGLITMTMSLDSGSNFAQTQYRLEPAAVAGWEIRGIILEVASYSIDDGAEFEGLEQENPVVPAYKLQLIDADYRPCVNDELENIGFNLYLGATTWTGDVLMTTARGDTATVEFRWHIIERPSS